jgi:hypothetical protein
MTFSVLILICALGTDDCTQDNARAVFRGPDLSTPVMCGMFGQAQIAGSPIGPHEDEFEKIVCKRKADP